MGRKGLEGRRRNTDKNAEGWQAQSPRPLSRLELITKISPGQSSRAGSKPKAILFSECLRGMGQIATVIPTESHLPCVNSSCSPRIPSTAANAFWSGDKEERCTAPLPSSKTAASAARPSSHSPGTLCLFRIQASAMACLTWGPGNVPQIFLQGLPLDTPGDSGARAPFTMPVSSESEWRKLR